MTDTTRPDAASPSIRLTLAGGIGSLAAIFAVLAIAGPVVGEATIVIVLGSALLMLTTSTWTYHRFREAQDDRR